MNLLTSDDTALWSEVLDLLSVFLSLLMRF